MWLNSDKVMSRDFSIGVLLVLDRSTNWFKIVVTLFCKVVFLCLTCTHSVYITFSSVAVPPNSAVFREPLFSGTVLRRRLGDALELIRRHRATESVVIDRSFALRYYYHGCI